MITCFTTPRTFEGHIGLIQRNAIRSWLQLSDDVILLGDEPGTADFAYEHQIIHWPNVLTNAHGTPLWSDLFDQAQRLAKHDILCEVSADIILLEDFRDALAHVVDMSRFQMVGQRWDVNLGHEIQFKDGWQTGIRAMIAEQGTLHAPVGVDYFVFRRGTFENLPPFAVGRLRYDNWMVWHALHEGYAVIDATEAITAVHQNHDHDHVGGKVVMRGGPEAMENERLARATGCQRWCSIQDADWRLTVEGKLEYAAGPHAVESINEA